MPATLVAPHLSSVALAGELSGMERAVALYASDMPTGYSLQGATDSNLADWIAQGVARLGRQETRRRASYLAGHRKLWLRDMTTPEIDVRHQARFPSKRRLKVAESMASMSYFWIPVAPAARDLPAVIDGPCPKCDDEGKLWGNWVIDADSEWYEEGYRPCWLCQSEGGAA
ncbi:hypothetical protein ACIRJO_40280 [Streptomyces sp. NPDC102394]|uniref:hypothetical protein n=1 Tax=Streptomyces sp. NPDC102394 TaxID=3366167 RepID=UPI003818BA65